MPSQTTDRYLGRGVSSREIDWSPAFAKYLFLYARTQARLIDHLRDMPSCAMAYLSESYMPAAVTADNIVFCTECAANMEHWAYGRMHDNSIAEVWLEYLLSTVVSREAESVPVRDTPEPEEEDGLPRCPVCRDEVDIDNEYTTFSTTHNAECHEDCWMETFFLCYACSNEDWLDDGNSNGWGEMYCERCFYDRYTYCNDCGEVVAQDDAHYDEYESYCDNCWDGEAVMSWNHTPMWNFWELPEQALQQFVPYFGLEVETSHKDSARMIVDWYQKECQLDSSFQDLVFVKDDSTVTRGYEIVTHPMTFEWANANFPWQAFDRLIEAGAYDTHPSCGGHVHINKDSFTNAHMWKFLQFHWRMSDFAKIMGGRNSDQWGSFGKDFQDQRRRSKAIAMMKNDTYSQRYSALNLIPTHTVELRYPAGGSSATLVRKNLQLAHSIWTFTKELDSKLVAKGILDDSGYFLWWLRSHEEQYPDLCAFIDQQIPREKPFSKENI